MTDDGTLVQRLTVTNTDSKPLPMTTALHTYFRVSDTSNVKVVCIPIICVCRNDPRAGAGPARADV